MGGGASVAKPTNHSKNGSTPVGQRKKADKQNSEVPNLMASLQGHVPNGPIHEIDDSKTVHIIDINNGCFSEKKPERIECDNIVEFKVNGKDEYDIIQVYKDGNDYYRVNHGYELFNVKSRTAENKRRIILSFDLNQPEIELYFCITPSSERETTSKTRKCPRVNCEKNGLKIYQNEIKFLLTDEKENQKVYLHKTDSIEITWTTQRGYRIEEKKYCPVSGGLYTVEQTSNKTSTEFSTKGKFTKTFNEFGMSFLFRLTETNQIHDITVCVVNETYKMKHLEITDDSIQPNIMWIEQSDWVVFDWNTKRRQTVVQIEPFAIDQNKQQPTELKTPGTHFVWPHGAARRGYMLHQFNEAGVYCFKTDSNQIGTIIVEAHKSIFHVPVFGEQSIYKMNTNDMVQFDWKMAEPDDASVLFTIDPLSSVVPHAIGGLPEVFNCATHKCIKIDAVFRRYLYTCETFLLNFPQHGLYNIGYSENLDSPLTSIIVENGIDNHRIVYDENNSFDPHTLIINRNDQVFFDSSSSKVTTIYETDEFGNAFDSDRPLFQPQENSINYFMKKFSELGIFYFSTEKNNEHNDKEDKTHPLAIIVLPEVHFHYQSISQHQFNHHSVITHVNDFVIWTFEKMITHNVLHLRSNDTLKDLIACHERAVAGKTRQCLAVECIRAGTFFFANPDFERVVGADNDRLIATIIVESPFNQNCFVIGNRQFIPSVLHIAQNETVSWVSHNNEQNHRIYIQPSENTDEIDADDLVNRKITDFLHDIHHIHTFHKTGKYIIHSDQFQNSATVFVYSKDEIEKQKKQLPEPVMREDIDIVSPLNTQIHLSCANRNDNIYYTLDGSTPTRHYDHVHEYKPENGIHLAEQGLHLVRAYSTADQKIASAVVTSSPTFVMGATELESLNEHPELWNTSKITLLASLQHPNKFYGNIQIDPISSMNSVEYFECYVNNVLQKEHIVPPHVQFSASGFAGGEQYEVYVIAHPKKNVIGGGPISSNKRAFEIKPDVPSGGPLISLATSTDKDVLFLLWAHIGNHVSEYIIYVDNVQMKVLTDKDFNELYSVQFHGAQEHRKYVFHVDAKIKNSKDIRKSNVISIETPLEMTANEPSKDGHSPYITINPEPTPSGVRLEVIELANLSQRRPEPKRTEEDLSLTNNSPNDKPIISHKPNNNGITLLWKRQPQATPDSVENYRIVVDKNPYGELIAPEDDRKVQVNLPPGKHECYLEVILKNKNEKVMKSNVLRVDVSFNGLKPIPKEKSEPSDADIHEVVEQKDLPIPKLTVHTINGSSIRTNWYLDRPLPNGVYIAMYEVHVRGHEFADSMTSYENFQKNGFTEHIWNPSESPLEISGLSERQEYLVFVRALFDRQGSNNTKYLKTTSNQVTTKAIDPLIDLLTRPLLKVARIGVQMVNLTWKLDDSVDPALIKGYRIVLNSKSTEILPPNQHEYDLRNLKPGTTNDVQVSVTSHPNFVDEKISEPIRIVCPKRPQPPTIQAIPVEKPFSIRIQWKSDHHDHEDVTSYKIYLDGKVHGEMEINGRQSFKYDFTKLRADQSYTVYVKSVLGQKKLDGNKYQCDVESNASNELVLKCTAPPTGTTPRIERMHSKGIDIVWDAPAEYRDVKLTGYQILKDGRSIGKALPIDKRRTSINDLQEGNRYSFQVVPITDLPGGTLFGKGEKYDADRHGHYLPGDKLEVEFTDLVRPPSNLWVEHICGRSALVCWSPIAESLTSNMQPDSYKISIWNNEDLTREKPMTVVLPKDKINAQLKDLQPSTTYEVQLEVFKKRRHPTTNDSYTVSATSEELTFVTGSPPDPPMNLHLTACTNTDARISFDPFVEHNAEIKTLRVQCEPATPQANTKETSMDLPPDATELILTNLSERTDYNIIIYGITEEYLNENRCREVTQLPKKLKPSEWLPNKNFHFQTSGCEPAKQIKIRQATIELIELEWTAAKVYGSTQCIHQVLRWQLENTGEEHSRELDCTVTNATIPGPLPSGLYKISLDTLFSVKINLEEENDSTSRKEIRLTINELASVRFHTPPACERPELYLTGYTTDTVDLAWNKPNMFEMIDHPEKNNEQLKIHRRLVGYRIDINERKHNKLDEDQCRCTLTDCQPGVEYKVQLIAQTIVHNEHINNAVTNDKENAKDPDETPSKKLRFQMLKKQDILRSFQANFEFNHNESHQDNNKEQHELASLGKINANWKVSSTKEISHFILQWRSSKDLRVQEKVVASNEISSTIESCDEKHYYVIDLIIVMNDGNRYQYEQLTVPIPGVPDAPKLWLVKTSDTSFVVEWSEPKSYGIPIIGFQLYIEGKKARDMIEVCSRRAEIPSRINRTYQVNVCAATNNAQRPHSLMSPTLPVITTPATNLTPTLYYNNDDGSPTSFDQSSIARIIPLRIEPINEEKLHIDWTSFLHTPAIRAYYIHHTCLNNGEVQAMKVSKRFRHAVLRGLRPGFTYGIMVMAVDKNGAVLYTSDKNTVQMNAPPNAPIVAISERTNSHVKLEWRPAASYGEIAVVAYKIFVNNRLAAILSHDQLTYTLTNGTPCDIYTVHVQALSNEKNTVSPMSRGVQFAWPGIKPGAFKRMDDGQTGTIIVAWEHPQLEDEMEKLIGYKLYSENAATHVVRLHGDYDAGIHQANIDGLSSGKYIIWLEIESDKHRIRSRPVTITSGRFSTLSNRPTAYDTSKCLANRQKRLRSPSSKTISPPLRHVQYS